jgi:uncharacterized protein with PIN domain
VVDLIVVNGRSVDFSHLVRGGDRVAVFPVFESFDIAPIVKVRPEPLRDIRFVADGHLGRLALFLRLLGFDTLYDRDRDDPELVRISTVERRIILTRHVGLLKRGAVAHGYFVRGTEPREQVTEVVRRFHLTDRLDPFTRCMACNGMLVPVDKQAIAHRLPEGTREQIDEFRVCSSCEKVYWEGAHHPELRRSVEAARRAEGLELWSLRSGVGIHSVADRAPPDETVDRPRRIPLQTPSSS